MPTREEALRAILASIAMEEAALSGLLRAEGEKVRYVSEYLKNHPSDESLSQLALMERNTRYMIESIAEMQILLKSKMRTALDYMEPPGFGENAPVEQPPGPPDPPDPPDPPEPPEPPELPRKRPCLPCVPEFRSIERCWHRGSLLRLEQYFYCNDGIELCRNRCGQSILLPFGRTYKIEFDFDFMKEKRQTIEIEMIIEYGKCDRFTQVFTSGEWESGISGSLTWESPLRYSGQALSFKLLSPGALRVAKARIWVQETL
ncbi:MAG: hypothetical protein LBS19_04450 [Clostridiales bacterium]|jgi:hypothetical protein|nr:hypothetical protein [Clostridiales bacterium]